MRIPYWHLEDGAEVGRSFPGIPMVINLPVASLSTTFAGIVDVMRTALAGKSPETLGKFFAGNAIRFYRMPLRLP